MRIRTQLLTAVFLIVSCGLHATARGEAPIPKADADKVAARLEALAAQRDEPGMTKMLDFNAMVDRVTTGVGAPPEFERGFRLGAAKKSNQLTKMIVDALGKKGTYHFLRARQVNAETRILFRMLTDAGGVNYHDWVISRRPDGVVRLVDVYIALSGETFSETMRRIYVIGAATQQPTLLDRLTGADKVYAANLKVMSRFLQTAETDPANALVDYYRLPKEVRESKSVMILRYVAASKRVVATPDEYNATVSDFRRLFPADPCLELICIDTLIREKKFDDARASLDKIQAFTGGDPYVDCLRGGLDLLEGSPTDFASAMRSYRAAADAEPTLKRAYWGMVTVSLRTKDFTQTVALLEEMRAKLNMRFNDLTKIPEYAEFVQSDAYRSWHAKVSASN